MNMSAKEGTDLIAISVLSPTDVFAPGGVETILSRIETEVRSFKADISTQSGRSAIASMAYKVARSKTALDEMGKDLVADLKKQTGAIDAERRSIRERLDILKDEVRKPLTDWENAEKDRVSAHEAALAAITENVGFGQSETADELAARLEYLKNYPTRDWQEFSARAAEAIAAETARVQRIFDAAKLREAERAELERLRAEQAAREQKEREDKIAAEAADRARVEAEAKARSEQRRVEQEKADAEARAQKAEQDRLAAIAKAETDAKAAAEAADRREREAIDAERRRVAAAEAAAKADQEKREADKQHRAKINGEARSAIVAIGLSDEQAMAVVTAIAKGHVPHTRIEY